jgi:hypothetical protein
MTILNKIGEKGRTNSAYKQGGIGGDRGWGGDMTQTMYAHMNK